MFAASLIFIFTASYGFYATHYCCWSSYCYRYVCHNFILKGFLSFFNSSDMGIVVFSMISSSICSAVLLLGLACDVAQTKFLEA
jgi:hypothetical protein